MPREEVKTPLGYGRTDYYIVVSVGGREFALPKSSLEKRFSEAILDARELHFTKHQDTDTYEYEVRGAEDVKLEQRKGASSLIQWYGIPSQPGIAPQAVSRASPVPVRDTNDTDVEVPF